MKKAICQVAAALSDDNLATHDVGDRQKSGFHDSSSKSGTCSLELFLILATIPADVGSGAQTSSFLGSQNEYTPLIPEELDSLVALIAVYPDALVAQVLGAATFPDQVTDANG